MPPRVFLLTHSRFWLILFIYISSSNHKMILTHILFRKWFTYRVSNPISTFWNFFKTLDFSNFLPFSPISSIWNGTFSQYGNFMIFNHSNFMWNQFRGLYKSKICFFNTFGCSEIYFYEFYALFEGSNLSNQQNSELLKWKKWQFWGIGKVHQGYQYTNPYTKPWFLI